MDRTDLALETARDTVDEGVHSADLLTRERAERRALTVARGIAPKELSLVMRGSMAYGLVIVSGPGDLAIDEKACNRIVDEMRSGADFLEKSEPRASLSFRPRVHAVTVDVPDTPSSYRDAYFMFELSGRTFLFWQSEAGWAAIRAVETFKDFRDKPLPWIRQIAELWSEIWSASRRLYMPFTLAGRQYFLTSESDTGAAAIREITYDATVDRITVSAPVWSAGWAPGDIAYMPFSFDPSALFFLSANATNTRTIRRITYDQTSGSIDVSAPVWSVKDWDSGSTVYMPFTLGVRRFFLLVNPTSGNAVIRQIAKYPNGSLDVSAPFWSASAWAPGCTVCMPLTLRGDEQYVLLANTTSGAAAIHQITFDATANRVEVTGPLWSVANWNPDYHVYVPFVFNRESHFLAVNVATGNIAIRKVSSPRAGLIDVDPDTYGQDWKVERAEGAWRDTAMQQLGYGPGMNGMTAYCEDLRRGPRADWAFVAFITRYKVTDLGYASINRLVMRFDPDGQQSRAITFAHESCHLFGASNEYDRCSAAPTGYYLVTNWNCETTNRDSIDCLMKNNEATICKWSRGQVGWIFYTMLAPFTLGGRQWIIGQDEEIGHAILQEVQFDPEKILPIDMPRPAWSAEWNPRFVIYMPFALAGRQFLLTADTVTGMVDIREIIYNTDYHAIRVAATTAWSAQWHREYASFVPLTLAPDRAFFLGINLNTASAAIHEITYDASSRKADVHAPAWTGGWSGEFRLCTPFTLAGRQYVLCGNVVSGVSSILAIAYDPATQKVTVSKPVWAGSLDPSYRVHMPFRLAGDQYVFSANFASGEVAIRPITYDAGTSKVTVGSPVWAAAWSPHYTIYVPLELAGEPFFLSVNNVEGRMNIRPIVKKASRVTVLDPVWSLP